MVNQAELAELYSRKRSVISRILAGLKGEGVYASDTHRPGKQVTDLRRLSESQRIAYFHGTSYPQKSWYRVGGLFETSYKAAIIEASKKSPHAVKLHLWKLIGVRVGSNVRIGSNVQIDYFYPELISIGNNVTIGDNVKLWNHDYSIARFAVSFLRIEDNVTIEPNCIIGPIIVGSGARIKANSVVLRNVKPGETVDNSDPQYRFYAEQEIEGGRTFKSFFASQISRLCRILPYDPVPTHIPLLKSLPFIEKLPALELKNKLYKLLGIRMGSNITFAPRVYVDAVYPNLITIGDDSLVGDGVIFRPYDTNGNPSPIVIGKHVKIGSESVIMGCHVGDNVQINLRSVVIGKIPPNIQVEGAPAKPVRGPMPFR
ncbi:hypothetical protein HYV85_02515 [Candidatus Woesearchaeota archaeon]|nr:hypothetical protein [Candidatus Woesearchaeota archaeon]